MSDEENDNNNIAYNKNSAASTALSCPTERSLRVSCYCEENVWRLVYRKLHSKQNNDNNKKNEEGEEQKEYHVVFISNDEKCCPMFHQLAKEEGSLEPCLWDYHVILICTTSAVDDATKKTPESTTTIVLDMDSRAPYPCLLQEYLWLSFRKLEFIHESYREKYAPKFRVVKAKNYLTYFYSNRMHMYKKKSKTWLATPPSYDCIMNGLDAMKTKKMDGTGENNLVSESGHGDNNNDCNDIDGHCSNLNRYIDMSSSGKKHKKEKIKHDDDDNDDRDNKDNYSEISKKEKNEDFNDNYDGINVRNEEAFGTVYTLDEFERKFCNSSL